MKNGIFTISLDFELHWGVMPRLKVEEYLDNLSGTRIGISGILQLFEKYEIHATWATVGYLFCENKAEINLFKPMEIPTYKNNKYNSYRIIEKIGISEDDDPYHFALSDIDIIKNIPFQEIATHTFSHYFCLEEGQSIEHFRADISSAIDIAKSKGIELKSIVFPRNQFNQEYLNVCKEMGIEYFRGNPKHYIYEPRKREQESKIVRVLRLFDAYVNISGYQVVEPAIYNGMVDIPASRFLRPYSKKLSFLDSLKLNRIKNEMTAAAKNNKIYHLWWHPHNFGISTEKNLLFLKDILEHYSSLKKKYDFRSMNMKEIGREYA